jgi:dynein heavy chain
LKALED